MFEALPNDCHAEERGPADSLFSKSWKKHDLELTFCYNHLFGRHRSLYTFVGLPIHSAGGCTQKL